MKRSICFLKTIIFITSFACLTGHASAKTSEFEIQAKTDRPDAIYKVKENATFSIEVLRKGKRVTEGDVNIILSLDGGKIFRDEKMPLQDAPLKVKASLDRPGFLRCDVFYKKNGNKFSGCAAAAYEPEKLKAETPEPVDFDKFWENGRKELAKIPLDTKLELVSSDEHQKSYMISFATLNGKRIYGYLSVPQNAKPPFPAYMHIASAGVGTPKKPESTKAKYLDTIVLSMSIHDLRLGMPTKKYQEIAKGSLKRYSLQGVPDKKKYYFRNVILGLDRAINYIYSRPDFDKKHFVLYGGSQGGGLSLIMAGLNKKITAAAIRVPAFCDHFGYMAERREGWPRIWTHCRRSKAFNEKDFLDMAPYYDSVNFAKRIKIPIIMEIGFIDEIIPPSSMYCAYNQIKSPKKLVTAPLFGHFGSSHKMKELQKKWISGQLGKGEKIAP